MKYHVTYFYLTTGMEGIPDKEDYGIIEADSPEEAKQKVVDVIYPFDEMCSPNNSYPLKDWVKGYLTAKLI